MCSGPRCVPIPLCPIPIGSQSSLSRFYRVLGPVVFQSRCVPVPRCPIPIASQPNLSRSYCVPSSLCPSHIVSWSRCGPVHLCPSPSVSQPHYCLRPIIYQLCCVPIPYVPVLLCSSPVVFQSRCVPVLLCPTYFVSKSHSEPVPLCISPRVRARATRGTVTQIGTQWGWNI